MKKNKLVVFILVVAVLASSFLFSAPAPEVDAASVVSEIMSKGCWSGGCVQTGGGSAVCTCSNSPLGNGTSSITVPFPRLVDAYPEFGLVGIPFLASIDWAGPLSVSNLAPKTMVVKEAPANGPGGGRFINFSTELKLSAVDAGDKLNDSIVAETSIPNVEVVSGSNQSFLFVNPPLSEDKIIEYGVWDKQVEISGFEFSADAQAFGMLGRFDFIEAKKRLTGGAISLPSDYIQAGKATSPFYVAGLGIRSSKNASGAYMYEGAKSYGMSVSAKWTLYVHAKWDAYEEKLFDHNDCTTVPQLPVATPRPGFPKPTPVVVCTPVYTWQPVSDAYDTGWMKAGVSPNPITVNWFYDERLGAWANEFAYPVYQSQPLLQVP